ncbi:MAG TPA: hypothetical protein PKL97_07170 [Candidatus Omnitrophota bacterium]|nr:hypothetical protein [Candidatus Omnitrophota bacterium]
MARDRLIEFVWIALSLFFFGLAGFHLFLLATASLEVNLPETVFMPQGKEMLTDLKNVIIVQQAISAVKAATVEINSFVNSYNRGIQYSNVYALCAYLIAGITCLFCRVLHKGKQ